MPAKDSDTLVITDSPPANDACLYCGASNQPKAKFCWMCGATVARPPEARPERVTPGPPPVRAAPPPANHRQSSHTLWLTSWLAVPVVVAVIFGLYLYEPIAALLVGPALALETVVALFYGTVFHAAVKPQETATKVVGLGTSILVAVLTAAGTFAATIIIIILVIAIVIISLCTGLANTCGIKFN